MRRVLVYPEAGLAWDVSPGQSPGVIDDAYLMLFEALVERNELYGACPDGLDAQLFSMAKSRNARAARALMLLVGAGRSITGAGFGEIDVVTLSSSGALLLRVTKSSMDGPAEIPSDRPGESSGGRKKKPMGML
jgi:hypothetical protein